MNTPGSPYAFIGRFTMFRNRIVSDILLCSPEEGNPNSIRVRAMWDTGCSSTIVSRRVADFLELKLNRERLFRTPFGGSALKSMCEAKICIVLGGIKVPLEVGVDEKPNSDPDCDVTLGLDFIGQGDFAISHNAAGALYLSFCYPPVGIKTDYTIVAPRFSPAHVITDTEEIDESDAVEERRRALIMLDYYVEAAKAERERKKRESQKAKKRTRRKNPKNNL